MSDIVERLREWSAADMDTHASLRRNGAQVAEVPWSRHGTDLAEVVLDAAAEIERLRAAQAAAWRAGVDAAAVKLRAMAARIRRATSPDSDKWAWTQAATLETAADALAEMEPSP